MALRVMRGHVSMLTTRFLAAPPMVAVMMAVPGDTALSP
jgi:hypothetical protein